MIAIGRFLRAKWVHRTGSWNIPRSAHALLRSSGFALSGQARAARHRFQHRAADALRRSADRLRMHDGRIDRPSQRPSPCGSAAARPALLPDRCGLRDLRSVAVGALGLGAGGSIRGGRSARSRCLGLAERGHGLAREAAQALPRPRPPRSEANNGEALAYGRSQVRNPEIRSLVLPRFDGHLG